MSDKTPKVEHAVQPVKMVAYSAFEQDGKTYQPGDEFVTPQDWVMEPFDPELKGIKFSYSKTTEWLDPQGNPIINKMFVVLPLEII